MTAADASRAADAPRPAGPAARTTGLDRRWRLAALVTLLAWCAVVLALRRTDTITDDWHGWRQADTQAIARSFAFEDFDLLRPRIDWRGDGPGFVESEAQLYPALIAVALRVTGDSVWPGQLLSLACVALTAAVLFAALARRYGSAAAYAALLAMLSVQGTIVISTSIQPDTLSLLAFTVGWFAFLDWLATSRRRHLVTWITATALAGLVKPTTLELGLAQGLVVVLAHRPRLRDPRLWLGWFLAVLPVAAYLLHARHLYLTYGNTFGVLSGGDSKLPAVAALAHLEPWRELTRYTLLWGIGLPAVPAALYLAGRRRLGIETLALAVAAAALCLLALRYTSGRFGTHYHLPHTVLGAWLVARAVHDLTTRTAPADRTARAPARRVALVVAAVAVCALALTARALHVVRTLPPERETTVGAQLAAAAPPNTLVVVRARAERWNPDWHTINNYEDPRLFYLSRTKGWVLANDEPGADLLAAYTRRGARYYAHVAQYPPDPALAAWLTAHATRVSDTPAGTIYRLTPPPP